ncbi:uncharacterized protein [Physcomitrium patens]|uniref:Prokaryotic-type class I peptide chain release factors domain-containing protein n=1 Tax=Physcomitrium patens TaxID=3218 RepID=A0A2K1KE74_PHYPA|nr:hypothetical protein PHYPA_008457 [Physcomitrium patens]
MRKALPWLKMSPLLRPLAYVQAQRNVPLLVPSLTCAAHNAPGEIRGACEKERVYWHGLRECRYISSPPMTEDEEGEAEVVLFREVFGEDGESVDTWKAEERLFSATTADRKRELGSVADLDWLRLTDRELQAQCRVETLRSSGPGGQHRNKTESAVRLLHLPTGLVSFAAEDRSQHKNRTKAFKRLREVIAVTVRQPVELKRYQIPPDLMRILPSTPQTRSKRGGGGGADWPKSF